MLEVGAVVHARRQHDDRRVVAPPAARPSAASRAAGRGSARPARRGAGEQLGEEPHHHLAVLEHVRSRRWARAGCPRARSSCRCRRRWRRGRCRCRRCASRCRPARRRPASRGGTGRCSSTCSAGTMPALQDLLVVVDVVDEAVQRGRRAGAGPRSISRHSCAGIMRGIRSNGISRSVPCRLRPCAVDGEGDADAAEDQLGLFAARRITSRRLLGEPAVVAAVVLAHRVAVGRASRRSPLPFDALRGGRVAKSAPPSAAGPSSERGLRFVGLGFGLGSSASARIRALFRPVRLRPAPPSAPWSPLRLATGATTTGGGSAASWAAAASSRRGRSRPAPAPARCAAARSR